MKKFLFGLAFIFITSPALAADPVEGYWLTENKQAVVLIEECETSSLCGYFYWLYEDAKAYDIHNPDEARRNDPTCGMQIIWGFEKDAPGEWSGGKIYKADDGDTYNANVKMEGEALRLRGYVGVPLFGKTQLWNRVNAADYPACQRPS